MPGTLLSEHTDAPFFQRMRAILSECVRSNAPVAAGPVRSNLPDKEFLEMEVVVMPLSEDGKTVSCLFGAMDVRGVGTGSADPRKSCRKGRPARLA